MSALRTGTVLAILALMLAIGGPCRAWLYDGGAPTISGPQIKDGTATVWVSQPFTLSTDSCVTSFGAAVARGFGNSQMGFDLYLSDRRFDLSVPVLASGTLRPLGPGYFYRYVYLDDPVRLNGGQKYYMTLVPNSNNFTGSVCWSYLLGVDGALSTADYGQTWSPYTLALGVRLDGYAAPEADAWAVLAAGMIALGGVLIKRGVAFRVGADRA